MLLYLPSSMKAFDKNTRLTPYFVAYDMRLPQLMSVSFSLSGCTVTIGRDVHSALILQLSHVINWKKIEQW